MHLISIIVPVYKAERYIHKCLDSIIAQTYTNWEAILVDDGSPDNCGTICDEYAQKDKRFKVIHQENAGVSVARQTGLDNTTGEFVIHCDPDDWIEPNMLEELYKCAIQEQADMVICDFIEEYKNHSVYNKQNLEKQVTAKEIQAKIINQQLHGSLCNKLTKRAVIKDTKFFPANISLGEDELFNIRILNNNIKVVYLQKAFYHYNHKNNTSLCSSKNIKIINSRKLVIDELKQIVDEKEFNSFFSIKKGIINVLFLFKQFKFLKSTFTEIHPIIHQNKQYHFLAPLDYFLSLALKGKPHIAFYLFSANYQLIMFLKRIKRIIVQNEHRRTSFCKKIRFFHYSK